MATTNLKQHIRGPDGKLYRSGERDLPESIKVGTAKDYVADSNTLLGTPVPSSSSAGGSNAGNAPADNKPPAIGSAGNPLVPSETATPLPAGFPGRAVLVKSGFDTIEKVDGASDKEITDLPGIGSETLQQIRAAIK